MGWLDGFATRCYSATVLFFFSTMDELRLPNINIPV
jgi:hypothetical protein